MRVLCIGGGPAGLYLALLLKRADPRHVVRVVERHRPYDTFGWGVVFSDQTLGNLEAADPETAGEIVGAFNHWDDIDVHFKGRTINSGGHGFCGIGRKRLLNILQRRCEALGVELVFDQDVTDDQQAAREFGADLVVASDGINSRIRTRYAETYAPDVDVRRCRFVWLGTTKKFPAFTFAFAETPHGWFQAHAYQYDGETSTFIVETPEEVWERAGLEAMSQEEGDRVLRAAVRAVARRAQADEQRRAPARLGDLDPLSARAVPHLGALDAPRRALGAGGAGRRRRAHGALLHRLGHQARARGRHRARPRRRRGRAGRPRARAGRLRGGARRRSGEDPERRAQLDRVVRERRPLHRVRGRAVRLQPADAQPAHFAREPAAARPRLRRADGALVRARRGRDGRARAAADVHAVHAARRHRCRTASWCRRWRSTPASTAFPTTTTSSTSAAARTAAPGWCSPRWSASRPTRGSRPAAPACGTTRRLRRGSASSATSTRARRRRSRCSSATQARRARRRSAGPTPTSRCPPARRSPTGRWSRRRRSRTGSATRCRAR